jgi:hypothetical protein
MHIFFHLEKKYYTAHEPKVGNNTLDQQVYDYVPSFYYHIVHRAMYTNVVKCINSNNHACKKICLSA